MSSNTFGSVLDTIGNTPMLKVSKLDTGCCELFLKLENQNPTGSIKDRIGLSLIDAAERDGKIKPGGTLIEATAGNTGLGLALVAAQKGYKLILVIPDKMAQEKIFHLKALGTQIHITRSDVAKGHPDYYHDVAERLAAEIPNSFYVNQFGNDANPYAHETTTGPEIYEQLDGRVDAVVCGVGSAGTITGLSRYFAEVSPATELVLADPKGSVLVDYIEKGEYGEAGSWLIEGIGEDFIPSIADFSRVKTGYTIDDATSLNTARELLLKEGILGGSSTGTLLAAALRYCHAQTEPKRVVSFVCDSGNKYLSKQYNDYWMFDQGLLGRPEQGNLLDMIARRYAEGSAITVRPEDTLIQAYRRMKIDDVSQVPVMEDDKLTGIIDESDILLAVHADAAKFNAPVREHMVTTLDTVPVDADIDDLLPIFAKDRVAIVEDDTGFIGLITRIDVLNYLRQRVQ